MTTQNQLTRLKSNKKEKGSQLEIKQVNSEEEINETTIKEKTKAKFTINEKDKTMEEVKDQTQLCC